MGACTAHCDIAVWCLLGGDAENLEVFQMKKTLITLSILNKHKGDMTLMFNTF